MVATGEVGEQHIGARNRVQENTGGAIGASLKPEKAVYPVGALVGSFKNHLAN